MQCHIDIFEMSASNDRTRLACKYVCACVSSSDRFSEEKGLLLNSTRIYCISMLSTVHSGQIQLELHTNTIGNLSCHMNVVC